MRKHLIIANWKMNPSSLKEAILLAQRIEKGIAHLRGVEAVIAPSFLHLSAVRKEIKKVYLGAQNVFWEDIGPYTGEVSWRQLKINRVKFVIVGHSERKLYLCETDEMINKKIITVLQNGFKAVLCVGERERADNEIPPVVGDQLKNALKGVEKKFIKNLIIAYEPIWAISTQLNSRPDTPDNAFRSLLYIRKIIAGLYDRNTADAVKVIYGGSVTSGNIKSFIKEGKMEGALVGGASLDAAEFLKILKESVR